MEFSAKDAINVIKLAFGTIITDQAKGFINVSQTTRNWMYTHFLPKIKKAGGDELGFTLNMTHGAMDPHVPVDGVDVYARHETGLAQGKVAWGEFQFPLSYNIERVLRNRSDRRRLGDYLTLTLQNYQNQAADAIDPLFMNFPASSASHARRPSLLGLPYWVPKDDDAELNDLAQCGKNPTGWSDVAGIDTSDDANANYRSWAARYEDGVLEPGKGVLKLLQDTCDLMGYVSPSGLPVGQALDENREFKPGEYRFFVNKRFMDKLKVFAANYGNHFGSAERPDIFLPGSTFCKRDFIYIPALDTDLSDPIYIIHDSMQLYGLDGMIFNQVEKEFKPLPNRHLEVGTIYDLRMQLVAPDRGRHCVLYKV